MEEARRKLEQQREKSQKPVFLSKQERQRLALGKRQAQVDAQRALVAAAAVPSSATGNNDINNGTDDLTPEIKELKAKWYGTLNDQPSTTAASTTSSSSSSKDVQKKRKANDKRVQFDWSKDDDTSVDSNPLYANRIQNTHYGRGHLGGMSSVDGLESGGIGKRRRVDAAVNWRDKPLDEMTDRDWRIMREELNISTKGGNIPKPIRFWEDSDLPFAIKDVVYEAGYLEPTPVQRQAIPIGLKNRDVIGIAETGSGKTLAFLIPMLSFIMKLPRLNMETALDGPYALILAPTRELAQQIEREAKRFTRTLGFTCVSIIGGQDIGHQSFRLRDGVEIVIATPGRLRDLIERRVMVLNQCTYVVLDEADRMVVDMGFEADLDFILGCLPVTNEKPDSVAAEKEEMMLGKDGLPLYRQTTMFSATMPPSVEKISKKYLRRPAIVTVGEVGQAVSTVEQKVEMIKEESKFNRLLDILSQGWQPPIIIFLRQKITVDAISKDLERHKFRVATLHGGRAQDAREQSLAQLRDGRKDLLVATDVAGRGIDIPDVSLVINYDMPKSMDDYTHRIGRTGRAGKKGTAISFLTQDDAHLFYELKQMLQKTNNPVPRDLANHEAAQVNPASSLAGGSETHSRRKNEEVLYLNGNSSRNRE